MPYGDPPDPEGMTWSDATGWIPAMPPKPFTPFVAEEKRSTVRVVCTVPNGLELRLFKQGHDDGAGVRPMVQDGPSVVLAGPSTLGAGVNAPDANIGDQVLTEVDAEFYAAWLKQNERNPIVMTGAVYQKKDEARDEPRHEE